MTEIPDKRETLSPAIERFILHWGEMGGQWGVNRSVAQIHALLYISEHPLAAEDISELLGMARSNVSNSLKELLTWNLIRRVQVMGDRRDLYEAEADVWEIARLISKGRKEREIDPALAALRSCVTKAESDPNVNPVAHKRLSDMLLFTETMADWYEQMQSLPKQSVVMLIRMGTKVVKFLPGVRTK
jgi:DNA-binding transcriptional regulator GbsR (MarR family)